VLRLRPLVPLTFLDLRPENLVYLTRDEQSHLLLVDFGSAKILDSPDEVATSLVGAFGYAAPEVMLKQGHGKPADMWSLGVITYTVLCGYSPFRSENLADLVEEAKSGRIIFHERYWREVSHLPIEFIMTLLQPDPQKRNTAQEALVHPWITDETTDEEQTQLSAEIRACMVRSKLRRCIERVILANAIEDLKIQVPDGPALRHAGPAIIQRVVLAKVHEVRKSQELQKQIADLKLVYEGQSTTGGR
jgi:calcium/calmodulin-dependent protein kinase I